METVYLSTGSNMGDRELNLLRAIGEIGTIADLKITALSRFYETEPIGPVSQNAFLNAVLRAETTLSPRQLLTALQRIETEVFHRKRMVAQGPRTMDIDILFYGDLVLDDADLTIPHPRIHERRFVLEPLSEIAPEFVHPVRGKTISELRTELGDSQGVTPL